MTSDDGGLGRIDLVGRTIAGRYELRAVLGRGGMATVYRAYQPGLDREVAVKVIAANLAHDPDFAERFRREARTVARLRHPHILMVHDFGEEQGLLYLTTELIVGGTLQDQLTGGLSSGRALELLSQVGEALDYAHARGVVHRDVKPLNVFVDRERGDQAILADFGIAKAMSETTGAGLTGTGLSIGTPEYMAPEQLLGQPVDGRADLYALAVIAYQLLTGRLPFARGGPHDTPIALALRKVQQPPLPPSVVSPGLPPEADRVLLRALATDPHERYATAAEFVAALCAGLVADQSHAPNWHAAPTLAGPAPAWAAQTTPAPVPYPAPNAAHPPGSFPHLQATSTGPSPLPAAAPPPVQPAGRPWAFFAAGLGATVLLSLLALLLWRAMVASGGGAGAAIATAPPGTVIAAVGATAATTPTTAPTPTPTATATATATATPTATITPTPSPTATVNTTLQGAPTPERPPATVRGEAIMPPTATPTPTPIPPPTPTATPLPPPTATPTQARPASGAPTGLLLYSSDKDGRWAIYRLNPDGGGERRLTDLTADNHHGVWSPDGRQIAFISERDGNPEIYLMNGDGSSQRRLTTDSGKHSAPIWSPDGRRVAYVLTGGGMNSVYVVDIATNQRSGLINSPAGWPAWSRNDEIAWTRFDSGKLTIFLSTVSGSGVSKVPGPDLADDTPAYSPDGNFLAFTSGPQMDRQIVVCRADGGGRRALTARGADNSNPVWSPDGAWIAYSSTASGSQQLVIMRSDGSNARTITSGPGKKWYLSWR
jgi:serine/threonine-protein kinase